MSHRVVTMESSLERSELLQPQNGITRIIDSHTLATPDAWRRVAIETVDKSQKNLKCGDWQQQQEGGNLTTHQRVVVMCCVCEYIILSKNESSPLNGRIMFNIFIWREFISLSDSDTRTGSINNITFDFYFVLLLKESIKERARTHTRCTAVRAPFVSLMENLFQGSSERHTHSRWCEAKIHSQDDLISRGVTYELGADTDRESFGCF